MIVAVISFMVIEARDGCCLLASLWMCWRLWLVDAEWLVGRRIFYVGSWQLALQKNEIYEKILFSKIFVTRRKMRKNDIEESEPNGLIRTYSTVFQDQTRFEKFNEKQWKNDEKIGKNTDQVAEHNVLNYTNTKNDSRVNCIGNNKKKIRKFKYFQANLIGQ